MNKDKRYSVIIDLENISTNTFRKVMQMVHDYNIIFIPVTDNYYKYIVIKPDTPYEDQKDIIDSFIKEFCATKLDNTLEDYL